jgi:hypothetical protein
MAQLMLMHLSSYHVERDRCCPDGADPDPPHPPGSGPQLLCLLLRDSQLARPRLPPRQAGFRRCHCRARFALGGVVP